LLWKSSREIHEKLDDGSSKQKRSAPHAESFEQTLVQLVLLDIVCSFDSVIAAVGMSGELVTMLSALVLAVFLMMRFAEPISRFILPRPRLRVLAFIFLSIIGLVLVLEGLGLPVSRPAVYAIMGLVLVLELPVSSCIDNTERTRRKPSASRGKGRAMTKSRFNYAACAPQSEESLLDQPDTQASTEYAAALASLNRQYTTSGEYRFFVDRV
jgi:predicted tellurium resistance membrane protein TerC